MKKGYHKTKSGKTAKKGLYYNINKKNELVHQEANLNLLSLQRLIKI